MLAASPKVIGGTRPKYKLRGELNFRGDMNPSDAMVALKDFLLCLLGFRFIYIVHISWYYIEVSYVLLPPTYLSFGLPVSPVRLSVSQTSMDNSGHKGNTGQLLNSRVPGVL